MPSARTPSARTPSARTPSARTPLPQTATNQQRFRIRIASHKGAVEFCRVFAIATRQNILPEPLAHHPAENSMLAELREGIGIQDLGPLVGVIARAVTNRTGK